VSGRGQAGIRALGFKIDNELSMLLWRWQRDTECTLPAALCAGRRQPTAYATARCCTIGRATLSACMTNSTPRAQRSTSRGSRRARGCPCSTPTLARSRCSLRRSISTVRRRRPTTAAPCSRHLDGLKRVDVHVSHARDAAERSRPTPLVAAEAASGRRPQNHTEISWNLEKKCANRLTRSTI